MQRPGSPALPDTKTSSASMRRRDGLTRTPAKSRWTDLRRDELRKKGNLWGCDQGRIRHPHLGCGRRTLCLDPSRTSSFLPLGDQTVLPTHNSFPGCPPMSCLGQVREEPREMFSGQVGEHQRSRQKLSELPKHGDEVGLGVLVFGFPTTPESQYNYS